ncbi:LytTR family transcriptional regulator DNA-binding domain-containing protein [Flavobacterium sp.]|uniref:LytR/AlgR family response regulator transcription factor n=1 Tax=Flavobacterium sp. TaxID=239 RepID=UPI0037536B9F
MKNFRFVIIDDDQSNGLKTRAIAESFQNLHYLASAMTYDDGIDCVLENNPDLIFLEIDPTDKESNLSFGFINELHRYLSVVPKIIITTKNDSLCLNAFKYGVFDYFINPIEIKELRKSIFRLEKEISSNLVVAPLITSHNIVSTTSIPQQVSNLVYNDDKSNKEFKIDALFTENTVEAIDTTIEEPIIETNDLVSEEETNIEDQIEAVEIEKIEQNTSIDDSKDVTFLHTENTTEKPLIICVKSYGDYRYIEAKDICYLQADNNSTDIHLNSGEMITAFKTLKHFEGVMTYPFVRIHNSYIVNIDFISRIHTGNTVCHIKNTTTKLPFSKSYKENIDAVITTIASGNYLEI